MSEEERVDSGMEINNDYELTAYLSHNKLQIWMTIVGGFVSLALVASITFLTWKFGNQKLIWFLILPAVCYTFG